MKITENVHKIRIDFQVTPQVKRYLNSIGRELTDIKGVFLTHSHPDHIGGAAELKKLTGCKIYAPKSECERMENIDIQLVRRIEIGGKV